MAEAKKLPQYVAAICVCIGAAGTGVVLGWTGTINESLREGGLNDIEMTKDDLGWVGSLVTLGAMFCCFPVGYFCDKFGRKPTTLFTVIPFSLGWGLIIVAQNLFMIFIGRFLVGIGGGSFCVTAPLYCSEIAEVEIRGRLGTFFQLFITIGILLAYLLGSLFSIVLYSIIAAIIPIAFAIVFFFQPETPYYNLKRGRKDKAEKAMKKLRGSEYNSQPELDQIQKKIDELAEIKGMFWATVKKKSSKKAILICFTLMFYQQLSGINCVIFYMSDIFKTAGSSMSDSASAILIGVVQVVATVFSSWLIEKTGRKILLMASGGMMAFATFILAGFYIVKEKEMVSEDMLTTLGFIPIISLILFIIGFSIGMGPIPWMAAGEMLEPEIKAIISSAAGTFNWFLAFVVTKSFHPLSSILGPGPLFFIFTVISASAIFFVLFVMPETKGKTITQVNAEMGN